MTTDQKQAEAELSPEFSKIIDVTTLTTSGRHYTLEPDDESLSKIAKRFTIPAIVSLQAKLKVMPIQAGATISGSIQASLVRECVASLEEMDEKVTFDFEITFDRTAPDVSDLSEEALADLGLEKSLELLEGPEPLEGDLIDIGELMVQQLSLAMDPFPRKEGAQSLSELYGTVEETSPFAILKGAITGDDDGNKEPH